MENKIESPDYQMDISEAGTVTNDNVSTSSASPTISNQAENESINGIDEAVNSIKFINTSSIKNHDKENVENRNTLTLDTNQQNLQLQAQKLTPVHHHPLMFNVEGEDECEDSCNNSHYESNFPDVVPSFHKPLRSAQPAAKTDATDIVNSVNNNIPVKNRKPMYREPSPVS